MPPEHSPAENYAQIDREALAIVFGVKRFHWYLYGWICSDHKPLMYIIGKDRATSHTASARIQRWALTLMGYQYTIVHQPGEELANADGLSHLPVPSITKDPPKPYDTILLMERLNASLVTAAQIREWTNHDPCLSKVRKLVMEVIQHSKRRTECGRWMCPLGHAGSCTTTATVTGDR